MHLTSQARRAAVGAAALVLGLTCLTPAAGLGAGATGAEDGTRVVLPTALDAPEGRASTVENDPTGAAAMAFTYGTTTEVETSIDPLVLAAGSDTYRRVRTAEERTTSSDLGAPAPMLLSPDGRTLAVGSSRDDGTVALVDLGTGEVEEVALDRVNATLPAAWDVENGYLWVRARYVYEDRRSGDTVYDDWEWHRVDLGARSSERLPPLDRALNVAPLPGTGQLLVRHNTGRAQVFTAQDLEPVGDSFDLSGVVEGWAARPDGQQFAVVGPDELRVHDAAEPPTVVGSVPVPPESRLLGWVDESAVLIGYAEEETGRWAMEQVDLAGGGRTPVTGQPAVGSGATVAGVSLATGLLGDLGTREPGEPDHGSLWARYAVWIAVAVAILLVAGLLLLLRTRSRRSPVGAATRPSR